jgi:hypothetical protein
MHTFTNLLPIILGALTAGIILAFCCSKNRDRSHSAQIVWGGLFFAMIPAVALTVHTEARWFAMPILTMLAIANSGIIAGALLLGLMQEVCRLASCCANLVRRLA